MFPKLILGLLVTIFSCNFLYGQRKSEFSFELLGSGGFGSFNFEKNIYTRERFESTPRRQLTLGLRFGFSFTPIDKNNGIVLVFPIMLHAVRSIGNHGIDFGLGQSVSITTKGSFFILTPVSLGYRYQPVEKNYYLRFAYTPLISYLFDFQYQHWAGITFGHTIEKKNESPDMPDCGKYF